jgi:hypothetical protein
MLAVRMDLTSSVRTDTLPALGSVVAPGALALSPYVALFLIRHPRVASYFAAHEATALSAGLVLSIGGGSRSSRSGRMSSYYLLDQRHADRTSMMRSWWRIQHRLEDRTDRAALPGASSRSSSSN